MTEALQSATFNGKVLRMFRKSSIVIGIGWAASGSWKTSWLGPRNAGFDWQGWWGFGFLWVGLAMDIWIYLEICLLHDTLRGKTNYNGCRLVFYCLKGSDRLSWIPHILEINKLEVQQKHVTYRGGRIPKSSLELVG